MLILKCSARFLLLSPCTLVLFAQAVLAQAHANPDTLWTKAVALAAANQHWVPTHWRETETIFDKNGKVEETNELRLHLRRTSTSALDIDVLSATKNGKDNADKVRSELEVNGGAFARDYPEDNLFAASNQHTVRATQSGEMKRINGRTYIGFSYVQTIPEGNWAGMAWLDAETGIPAQVESSPTDLPMKEDGLDVLSLTSVTTYNVSAPDAWYPITVQLDIAFRAKYAVFSFNGISKTTITLSGYERP